MTESEKRNSEKAEGQVNLKMVKQRLAEFKLMVPDLYKMLIVEPDQEKATKSIYSEFHGKDLYIRTAMIDRLKTALNEVRDFMISAIDWKGRKVLVRLFDSLVEQTGVVSEKMYRVRRELTRPGNADLRSLREDILGLFQDIENLYLVSFVDAMRAGDGDMIRDSVSQLKAGVEAQANNIGTHKRLQLKTRSVLTKACVKRDRDNAATFRRVLTYIANYGLLEADDETIIFAIEGAGLISKVEENRQEIYDEIRSNVSQGSSDTILPRRPEIDEPDSSIIIDKSLYPVLQRKSTKIAMAIAAAASIVLGAGTALKQSAGSKPIDEGRSVATKVAPIEAYALSRASALTNSPQITVKERPLPPVTGPDLKVINDVQPVVPVEPIKLPVEPPTPEVVKSFTVNIATIDCDKNGVCDAIISKLTSDNQKVIQHGVTAAGQMVLNIDGNLYVLEEQTIRAQEDKKSSLVDLQAYSKDHGQIAQVF